ncbi:unnamed protein product [Absidia cylindrospora]
MITYDMNVHHSLKEAGIIPDLVNEDFYPDAFLVMKYGDELVSLGNHFTTEQTAKAPEAVFLPVDEHAGGYTILLIDPDVPSTSNHSLGPYNHWTVVNIPGGQQEKVNDPSTQLVAYHGPAPPPRSGDHRYIFLLYKQQSQLQTFQPLPSSGDDRKKFDFKHFAETNHLELIGVNFFYCAVA